MVGRESIFDNGNGPYDNDGPTPACDFDEVNDMRTALEELLAKPDRHRSDETENMNTNT